MKTVPVEVYVRGELNSKGSNWELGVWDFPIFKLENEEWVDTKEKKQIWGLVYEGRRTHMSYEYPYADPVKWAERVKQKAATDPDPDWLRWYFDAGSNGRPIYVTLEELEKKCKLLGIWNESTETLSDLHE